MITLFILYNLAITRSCLPWDTACLSLRKIFRKFSGYDAVDESDQFELPELDYGAIDDGRASMSTVYSGTVFTIDDEQYLVFFVAV